MIGWGTVAFLAMLWVLSGHWAAYGASRNAQVAEKTYEQQYPSFEGIAETLQNRFTLYETSNTALACAEAILQHPAEELVEWWLNSTRENYDSLNLLFYGGAMLGKSCTVRKILDKLAEDKARFFYHLYNRGFDAFVEDLCYPAIIGPDKPKAVYIALAKYTEYMKGNFDNYNVLIVVDFVNYDDTAALETLSKSVRDLNYPIRFVFIASEARAPVIFQRRVDNVRLTEGDDDLARDYLGQIVGIKNTTQIDNIVQFTGSIFKYLAVVKNSWARAPGDVADAQQAVYDLIENEVGFLLSPSLYPEVVEICKQLIAHNDTLDVEAANVIFIKTYEEAPEGYKLLSVDEILQQNLFLVEKDVVQFQNRATASFVRWKLQQKKW